MCWHNERVRDWPNNEQSAELVADGKKTCSEARAEGMCQRTFMIVPMAGSALCKYSYGLVIIDAMRWHVLFNVIMCGLHKENE